jgi:hypothetical protein
VLSHAAAVAAVQAVPLGLPTQVPLSQIGLLPLQPPQHSEMAMQPPLQSFWLPVQVTDVVPLLPVPRFQSFRQQKSRRSMSFRLSWLRRPSR